MIDPIENMVKELEKHFGSKVVLNKPAPNQLVIKNSSGKTLPSISIVSTANPKVYSVQVEVSDENAPLVGLDIPVISDSVSLPKILQLVGEYVVAG